MPTPEAQFPTLHDLSRMIDQSVRLTEYAQSRVEHWQSVAWRHRRIKAELEALAILAEVRSGR